MCIHKGLPQNSSSFRLNSQNLVWRLLSWKQIKQVWLAAGGLSQPLPFWSRRWLSGGRTAGLDLKPPGGTAPKVCVAKHFHIQVLCPSPKPHQSSAEFLLLQCLRDMEDFSLLCQSFCYSLCAVFPLRPCNALTWTYPNSIKLLHHGSVWHLLFSNNLLVCYQLN